MDLCVFKTDDFVSSVVELISKEIKTTLMQKSRCSLVLSGGSTPKKIYTALAKSDLEWNRVDLFWGDERWVPATDSRSNYLMVKESLLEELPVPPGVYAVDTSLETPAESARDYSEQVSTYLKAGRFDIVLLGVGTDGHTASIFPDSPVLHDSSAAAFAVSHPDDGTERITLSAQTLFSAQKVRFIVQGAGKAQVLRDIKEQNFSVEQHPARLYEDSSSSVVWVVDAAAASLI